MPNRDPVASLLLGFAGADPGEQLLRSGVLTFGVAAIWLMAACQRAEAGLRHFFVRVFRGKGTLAVHDYSGLLQIGGDYSVGELQAQSGDWLAGRTLADVRPRDEGVVVLGIEREGEYRGAPDGESRIEAGDTLVVYGRAGALRSLDDRVGGTGANCLMWTKWSNTGIAARNNAKRPVADRLGCRGSPVCRRNNSARRASVLPSAHLGIGTGTAVLGS